MSERLDHLLDRLSASDAELSAPGLEVDVMRGVARAEADRRTAAKLAPLRVGAVGLALVMGVTAGGLAAARTVGGPAQGGALSGASSLAPSTLLEGTR
jgi:soluble lytic murein transglycosylase-like protein